MTSESIQYFFVQIYEVEDLNEQHNVQAETQPSNVTSEFERERN
jgi:hypothetical protein